MGRYSWDKDTSLILLQHSMGSCLALRRALCLQFKGDSHELGVITCPVPMPPPMTAHQRCCLSLDKNLVSYLGMATRYSDYYYYYCLSFWHSTRISHGYLFSLRKGVPLSGIQFTQAFFFFFLTSSPPIVIKLIFFFFFCSHVLL